MQRHQRAVEQSAYSAVKNRLNSVNSKVKIVQRQQRAVEQSAYSAVKKYSIVLIQEQQLYKDIK